MPNRKAASSDGSCGIAVGEYSTKQTQHTRKPFCENLGWTARPVASPWADAAASSNTAAAGSEASVGISLADRRRAVGSQKDKALELPPHGTLPDLDSPLLEGEALKRYQSVAARLNYLALGCSDLQCIAQGLMRHNDGSTRE